MPMSTRAVLLFGAELRWPLDEANALWSSMYGGPSGGQGLIVGMETFDGLSSTYPDGTVRPFLYVEASRRSIRTEGRLPLDPIVTDPTMRREYEETFASFCAERGITAAKPGWHMIAVYL